MDIDLKAKWVAALRSGTYQQTQHQLKDDVGFCCLGVLCDIQGADFDAIRKEYGTLSLSANPAKYFSGVPHTEKLSTMNDEGVSFSEIAGYIEENL